MKLSLLKRNHFGKYDHLRNKSEEGLETYENMKRVNRSNIRFFVFIVIALIIGFYFYLDHTAAHNGINHMEQINVWYHQFISMNPKEFDPSQIN